MDDFKAFGTGDDFKAVDVPLSNFAVAAYNTETEGMIADRLFPGIAVGKQSDGYYILTKDDWLRIHDAARAPGTRANRIEFSTSTDTFFTPNFALATETPLEDFVNADSALDIRENNTDLIVSQLKRGREKRIADICTSIDNLGSGVVLSGTDQWDDFTNSDPFGDVATARAFMRNNTGLTPNTMVLPDEVFELIRRHPDILDLHKHTSGGTVGQENIAAAFRVQTMLIVDGIENTATEGAAFVGSTLWGKTVLLAHVGPGTGKKTRTFGVRFMWRNPLYPGNFAVKRKVYDGAGEEGIEVQETGHYEDEKVVARDLAYAITDVIS